MNEKKKDEVNQELLRIVDRFKDKKVLVVGDPMLDEYLFSEVKRISPEAPVQIARVAERKLAPGGAANTANNIQSIGGQAILIGVIGQDHNNDKLKKILTEKGIKHELIEDNKDYIITDDGRIIAKDEATEEDITKTASVLKRPTITKTRVIAKGQQLLRYDEEQTMYINKNTQNQLLDAVKKIIGGADIVVISDYAKGTLTSNVISSIIRISNENKKKVIVDPRPKHAASYENAYLITPNSRESKDIIPSTDIEERGRKIGEFLNSNVVITRGKKGMAIFEKGVETKYIPTEAKKVYNVTGAGDTVVAAIALSVSAGASLEQAAYIANKAAAITVAQVGTYAVKYSELKEVLKNGITE